MQASLSMIKQKMLGARLSFFFFLGVAQKNIPSGLGMAFETVRECSIFAQAHIEFDARCVF